MDKQKLLMELTDGIIGDYYPSPSRCLPCTETILNEYLQSTLYNEVDLKAETQVFPTEGALPPCATSSTRFPITAC